MYRYQLEDGSPATTCPECGCELDIPGNVILEVVTGGRPWRFDTCLDEDGSLVDVDNLVANGYHGATICGGCENLLIDVGVEEVDTN